MFVALFWTALHVAGTRYVLTATAGVVAAPPPAQAPGCKRSSCLKIKKKLLVRSKRKRREPVYLAT